jgi:hypothetical protein
MCAVRRRIDERDYRDLSGSGEHFVMGKIGLKTIGATHKMALLSIGLIF